MSCTAARKFSNKGTVDVALDHHYEALPRTHIYDLFGSLSSPLNLPALTTHQSCAWKVGRSHAPRRVSLLDVAHV